MTETLIFGESDQDKKLRRAAKLLGLENATGDIANVKTYLNNQAKFEDARRKNWVSTNISTALGKNSSAQHDNYGGMFDGRYVYYIPNGNDDFLRYDTREDGHTYKNSAWELMGVSTVIGSSPAGLYTDGVFDGRYVYFISNDVSTFARFDTWSGSGEAAFQVTGNWQIVNRSTAAGHGGVPDFYAGGTFDGRYVYMAPQDANRFVRFDTEGDFTAEWDNMHMSTVHGTAPFDSAYHGACFDGRYVYYGPRNSNSFYRFDTQGTDFQTIADWEAINMTSVCGGSPNNAYHGPIFDGRYVYYAPRASHTFVRFDTQGDFTSVGSWETIRASTALGFTHEASIDKYGGTGFDGRYIYFTPRDSDTISRFDIFGTFTDPNSWDKIRLSTAKGAGSVGQDSQWGYAPYDGKNIYFIGATDNFPIKHRAFPSK